MYDYSSEIRFKIASIISEQKQIALARVLESKSLNQLGIDLMDLVEVILKLEKTYLFEIPERFIVKSLEDMVEYVYCNTTLPKAK